MDLRALYGTEVPPEAGQLLRAGAAQVTLEGGNLRHLRLSGVELIRAVAFLVRDRDWGTLAPEVTGLTVEAGRVSYAARYISGAARLDVTVTIRLSETTLDFEATAHATGDFETNRCGFTVLHPINGVAGAWVRVEHGDGSREDTRFPALIEPWQPFKDITALTHRAGGVEVECRFEGDVFEMEDQRQWGDASYKTYVRPLALPWPYVIEGGAVMRQAVRLRWRQSESATPAPAIRAEVASPHFPQTALVLTAREAGEALENIDALRRIAPQRILCHFDAAAGHDVAELAAFAALQASLPGVAFDLELIARCPLGSDLDAEFASYAAALSASGLAPAAIMTCPSVDRQSTPPGSDWPPCPPLEAIHAAARRAFPAVSLGGGMASFFPELNRKRPPVGMLDFVAHGFCPITHAADDLSVMETLETLPHILDSARTIIGGRGYRLGPSTIAMRQSPYGSRTIPNRGRGRVCMADDDPRQDGAFAAAWTLGLAAQIARAGLEVWTPAGFTGPRGLLRGNGSLRPVAAVIAALAAQAGQPVGQAGIGPSGRLALLAFPDRALVANLTPLPLDAGLLPAFTAYEWRVLSPQDLQSLPQDLMP